MVARMLTPLTLDAVKAESIALDLRMIRGRSPFDPSVGAIFRAAELGDQLAVVFKEATRDFGGFDKTDPVTLSKNLITLAAQALAWAQVLYNENARPLAHVHAPYCGCSAGVEDAEGSI